MDPGHCSSSSTNWLGKCLGIPVTELLSVEGWSSVSTHIPHLCPSSGFAHLGYGFKLTENGFRWDTGKEFLDGRVGRPRKAVAAPASLEGVRKDHPFPKSISCTFPCVTSLPAAGREPHPALPGRQSLFSYNTGAYFQCFGISKAPG